MSRERDADVDITVNLTADAKDVREKLRTGLPKKRINVLLLGLPSVGKSSLINSLIMAIRRYDYEEIAQHGKFAEDMRHVSPSYTKVLRRYVVNHKLDVPGEKKQTDYKSTVLLWDCPGLKNEKSSEVVEALSLIFKGNLPSDFDLEGELTKTEQELRDKYEDATKLALFREIDIAFFVYSWEDVPPENFIKAIVEACRRCSGKQITICLVATKIDIAQKINRETEKDSTAVMEKRVERVAELLGLPGKRIFKVTLYHDGDSDRNEERDQKICEIWKAIQDDNNVGVDIVLDREDTLAYEEMQESLRREILEKKKLQDKIKVLEDAKRCQIL